MNNSSKYCAATDYNKKSCIIVDVFVKIMNNSQHLYIYIYTHDIPLATGPSANKLVFLF